MKKPKQSGASLTTTEAAKLLQVSAATLKRWEQEGLVRSDRTEGGHRRFSAELLLALRDSDARSDTKQDGMVERLLASPSPLQVSALLQEVRSRANSWWSAADQLKPVIVELHRRRESGTITRIQWEEIHERLNRGLVRFTEAAATSPGAGALLMVRVPGDPLALPTTLLELCALESGWNPRWGGQVDPEDLLAELQREPADAVVVSASGATDPRVVGRLGRRYLEVAVASGVPAAFIGLGRWPAEIPTELRLHLNSEVRSWLEATAAARRPGIPAGGTPSSLKVQGTEGAAGAGAATVPVWREGLALDHGVLDAQHRALFEQVALFFRDGARPRPREETGQMLAFLSSYASNHFREEEALMREIDYPHFTEHNYAHEQFSRYLLRLGEELERTGEISGEPDLAGFLASWLQHHVSGLDRSLGAFMRSQGSEP